MGKIWHKTDTTKIKYSHLFKLSTQAKEGKCTVREEQAMQVKMTEIDNCVLSSPFQRWEGDQMGDTLEMV